MIEALEIKLFIPVVNKQPCLKEFYDMLIREFNGFTVITNDAHGYWKNPDTQKVEHDVIQLIEIFTKKDVLKTYALLSYELYKLGLKLNQSCMFYAINNKAYYVYI